MLKIKYFSTVFVLCLVYGCLAKQTTDGITKGRGIGSTIWEWITYPFSWWGSGEPELPPVHDQLVGSTPYGPYDNIEIGKHNVTVWCNDQTCTTMRCDKSGCKNVTCNVYDTNMSGECREYNMAVKPEEPISKPTEATSSIAHDNIPQATTQGQESAVPVSVETTTHIIEGTHLFEEHPLELEAVLSSTVTEKNKEKKEDKTSSPQNKI